MMVATKVTWLPLTLAMILTSVSISADNWPQWRGPAGTGASSETQLPASWSNSTNIAWRTRLSGVGVSSPIVWGERVFVTSQVGRGASRQGPRLGQGAEASAAERSLESGTTSPDQGVRFLVEPLDRTKGGRLWTFELPAEGDPPSVHDKHNLASPSPVADGERVYAVFGTGQVVAVDMMGKQVWTRNLTK